MATHPSLPPVESADDVVQRFLAGRLDRDAWTHPAHLIVCRHLLGTSSSTGEAIARMRYLIQTHNERVGIQPGHGGYHETITRYFVEAVANAGPLSLVGLLTEPTCRREAPRNHWSATCLGSDAARRDWVEPDLRPLPWVASGHVVSGQVAID